MYPSTHPTILLWVYLWIYVFNHSCMYPSIYLCIHPFIYLCIYPSMYLSIHASNILPTLLAKWQGLFESSLKVLALSGCSNFKGFPRGVRQNIFLRTHRFQMYLILMELHSRGESKVPVQCTCLTLRLYAYLCVNTFILWVFIINIFIKWLVLVWIWVSGVLFFIFLSTGTVTPCTNNSNQIKVLALTLD